MATPQVPALPDGHIPVEQRIDFDHAALTELRDRTSVEGLVKRFILGIDFRDWNTFRSCFADTVEVKLDPRTAPSPPGPVPADAWVKIARASFEPYDSTHHLVSVYAIRIDGDEAEALSYFQASHYSGNPDGAPTFVQKGTYVHRFQRTEAGWRISGWVQDVRWGEGNRAVLDRAMDQMPDL